MIGRLLVVVALLVAGACSGPRGSDQSADGPAAQPGADEPGGAAVGVLRATIDGDFARATDLTALDQMPIIALLEGVPVREAVRLDTAGRRAVAANFWQGFGARLDLPGDPSTVAEVWVRRVSTPGEFSEVSVSGIGTEPGVLVVRREMNWYVDVLASFGPVLIGNLAQAVDSLSVDPGADAGPMLDLIRSQRPSLVALRSRPGIPVEVRGLVDGVLERLDE